MMIVPFCLPWQIYSVPEFKLVFSVRNFSSAPTTLKDSGLIPQQRYKHVQSYVYIHGYLMYSVRVRCNPFVILVYVTCVCRNHNHSSLGIL